MKRIACVGLLLAACSQVAETDPIDTALEAPAPDGSVVFADDNNYAFTGTLDGPSFDMAEQSDATLDWSRLVTDLQCHALDPVADIDNVALLNFPYLSEVEVEAGLSTDTLFQADLRVYLSYEPGDTTSASLSQVTFFGTDPEIEPQFQEGTGTWMMLLTTGTEIAVGARMIAFLNPVAGETRTRAELDDGCGVLDFSADLTSLTPVPVLRDGPWRIDWSGLTRDGQGAPFEPTRVDTVMVGRFEEDLTGLEASFLDLEALAEELHAYPVSGGTTVDLAALSDGSFPGFDLDGTWILALRCSSCANPAPLFLTVLLPV